LLLGAQPTIEQMLPLMARYTPLANASRIANLRAYALATAFVHHRSQPQPVVHGPDYPGLITDAYALRRRLGLAAVHLAALGLLDARRVAEIQGRRGHVGTGDGLLALATLFEERWAQVKDSTPIERHELRHAADLGARLLAVAPARRARRGRTDTPQPNGLRRRAIHMMCNAYDEARRVAEYIAWYEPELHPLPSLFQRVSRDRIVTQGEPLTLLTAGLEDEAARMLAAAE
jgi:hypothetical protein